MEKKREKREQMGEEDKLMNELNDQQGDYLYMSVVAIFRKLNP